MMGTAGGVGEEWFREWFGSEYIDLYPHRDAAEARRAVRLFHRAAKVRSGGRILDLACGRGRHLRDLHAGSHRAVGLDLSGALLRRARELVPSGGPALVRGDMRRLPFRRSAFDGVVSFFTSFGYFDSVRDDERVLEEVRRVLRDEGTFLLDFLNAGRVRRTLVEEDERVIDGRRIRQRRRIDGDFVVKRIEIEGRGESDPPRVFHERVRLYDPERLETMLRSRGLRPASRYGNYRGDPFDPDAPRLILVGSPA